MTKISIKPTKSPVPSLQSVIMPRFPLSALAVKLLLSLTTTLSNAHPGYDHVFIEGSPLIGGTNGIAFDPTDDKNAMWACQSLGRAITKVDTETGAILDVLGQDDEVLFPDDVTFGPDGTMYWTEFFLGTVYSRSVDGPSTPLYPWGTYPNANPVALDDSGERLFFAQCWAEFEQGVYQLDLTTNVTTTLADGITGCSSNSMDYYDGFLYGPRAFEGRVVSIDLSNDNYTVSTISSNMSLPNALKFDSQGNLYVLDSGVGHVYRIDREEPDLDNNRILVADPPLLSIDNLMFDSEDRLYISSVARGTIYEVLSDGNLRTVVPGPISIITGFAVIGDVLHLANPNALFQYSAITGDEISIYEPPIGTGGLEQPVTVSDYDADNAVLLLISFASGTVVTWNVDTNTAIDVGHGFSTPVDAHKFQDGVLVTEALSGAVYYAFGANFEERQVVLTVPGATMLAGDSDGTVIYMSNFATGEILRIVENSTVLEAPVAVSSGHAIPEGIELLDDMETLLVVCSGSGTLEKVNLVGGEVTVLEEGLKFQPPLPGVIPFGFPNDVVVYDGEVAFVNGDGSNEAIYSIPLMAASPTAPPSMPSGGSHNLPVLTVWILICVVGSIQAFVA